MSGTGWTPPPVGAPCWIQVFATDVGRARKFYEQVFNWKIREGDKPEEMVHFDTPASPGCPGGGICKVKGGEFIQNHGRGGVALYLMVDDIDAYGQKIVKAGGKKVTEVEPEGANAVMQNFEDTEGNFFGIYEWRGKN